MSSKDEFSKKAPGGNVERMRQMIARDEDHMIKAALLSSLTDEVEKQECAKLAEDALLKEIIAMCHAEDLIRSEVADLLFKHGPDKLSKFLGLAGRDASHEMRHIMPVFRGVEILVADICKIRGKKADLFLGEYNMFLTLIPKAEKENPLFHLDALLRAALIDRRFHPQNGGGKPTPKP